MGRPTGGGEVRVDVRRADGSLSVAVAGEVDIETAPVIVRRVLDELERGAADVEVRAGGVTFMDSTGTKALVELRDAVARTGRAFSLVQPSRPVRVVLELSGLADQFEIDGGAPDQAPPPRARDSAPDG